MLINYTTICKIRGRTRKFLIAGIALCILIVVLLPEMGSYDRQQTINEMERAILSQKGACKHPILPINSSELINNFYYTPPLDCKGVELDWVVCQGSRCYVTKAAQLVHQKISCAFTDLIRNEDRKIVEADTTKEYTEYNLTKSDMVHVECESISGDKWFSVLVGIRKDEEIVSRPTVPLSKNVLPVDVLMFGFDSLSHNTFMRKLPKTYNFLTETLGASVLKGYNIVGDGTPQALIPILTGKTELELPDVRKRIAGTDYVDVYPFIWKDFTQKGYVTAYLEDMPDTGIFTYRLRGFHKPPTDHYMPPYYTASAKKKKQSPAYCVGSQLEQKISLNYMHDFFQAYRKQRKYLFGFNGELSHDDVNLIGGVDNDVLEWLVRLSSSGVLNNTILIIFSDHGHRFLKIRNTLQGKQEERLPFFSITLPRWVREKYKKAYENLKHNEESLTTPFDIYSTIKHILNWKDFGDGDLRKRSISLFQKIPEERSCADAYIEPHWCACLHWDAIAPNDTLMQSLAQELANKINQLTENIRHMCTELHVSALVWANKLSPNNNLIKFSRTVDKDGFVPALNAKLVLTSQMYQIKVIMAPSQAIYEGTLTVFNNKSIVVHTRDISRVDQYGSQASCVLEEYPDLRKFCFCKS